MATLPLLPFGDVSVGDRVQALASDGNGLWWDARVVAMGGKGKSTWAEVKFDGWGTRFNETFKQKDNKVRARLAKADPELQLATRLFPERIHLRRQDGTWLIEKLIMKRRRRNRSEYLVRWQVCLAPAPGCA